ncbi:hypothetical protein [Paenibacillus gansuensis]|uniref:VanZ-like domain-containing protein n=1 Tax=Paenibacillus gansuensis TaxID=306542 RepID=A0ABW5P7Q7_9BACL
MNPTIKRMVMQLVYVAVFLFLCKIGLEWQSDYLQNATRGYHRFENNVREIHLVSCLLPLGLGVLLALPRLRKLMRQPGTWRVDWFSLIIVGLPALYVLLLPIFLYSGIRLSYLPLGKTLITSSGGLNTATTLSGVILGYLWIVVWKRGRDTE